MTTRKRGGRTKGTSRSSSLDIVDQVKHCTGDAFCWRREGEDTGDKRFGGDGRGVDGVSTNQQNRHTRALMRALAGYKVRLRD